MRWYGVFVCLFAFVGMRLQAEDSLPPLASTDTAGYVSGQLIYPLANRQTPQCHASTIVETQDGLVAAWFGGRTKVVAVETTGTSSLDHTLKGTLPADFAATGLSASGLGASSIGDLNIEIIRSHVAENVVVSDADVSQAAQRLWAAARLVCEPGGVTALAALTSGAYVPAKGERVAVVLCGGNDEPNWFEG